MILNNSNLTYPGWDAPKLGSGGRGAEAADGHQVQQQVSRERVRAFGFESRPGQLAADHVQGRVRPDPGLPGKDDHDQESDRRHEPRGKLG